MPEPSCVVMSGAYGSGKSSVLAEMAGVIEERGTAYAALDLDWYWWFDAAAAGREARRDVLMANVAAVVGNYRDAGVERFLMAWAIEAAGDLAALRRAVTMPLRVVYLAVPIEVIRHRLASSPITERRGDFAMAQRQMAAGAGRDGTDFEVDNTRPIREVALEIIDRLGWT